MTAVTLLHPGHMGAAIAAQARAGGAKVLWCPAGRSDATWERAKQAGLESAELGEALSCSDVVLSICPPAVSEDIARQVADHRYSGLYVDANAISPQRAERIGHLLAEAGGRMLDASIIGPPPSGRAGTRLYVCGESDAAEAVRALFADTRLEVVTLAGPVGTASALKMAFGSFQKSARTLAAVSHALAAQYGVGGVLAEEGKRMASGVLAEVDYLPSVAARAWRWAPEMREAAATLRVLGLPTELADGAAEVMQRWDRDRDQFDLPVSEVLDHLKHPG